MSENPFSRSPRGPLILVHPKKPTPQELADDTVALARRCRAAGFDTTALLLEEAAVAMIVSRWPPPDSDR